MKFYKDTFFRDEVDNSGSEVRLPVTNLVHPSSNGKVIINYPGYNGEADGYVEKYVTLGNHLRHEVGAFVRTDNFPINEVSYPRKAIGQMASLIERTLDNSEKVAGVSADELEIYLMGFSAGAGAVAAISNSYSQVRKILLMAPAAGNVGIDPIREGLSGYTGECYIATGENDEVVGGDAGDIFAEVAQNASVVRNLTIPNCNHQFHGERNGRIMSSLALRAFHPDLPFEVTEDKGIKLYD